MSDRDQTRPLDHLRDRVAAALRGEPVHDLDESFGAVRIEIERLRACIELLEDEPGPDDPAPERLRAALHKIERFGRLPLIDMAEPDSDKVEAYQGHIRTICHIAREALGDGK